MLEDTVSSWAHVVVVEAETPGVFLSVDIKEILRVLVPYFRVGIQMNISCIYRQDLKDDLWKEDAVPSGMGTYLFERHLL